MALRDCSASSIWCLVLVSRGEKMLYAGTDPESYITEYTLVYEDKT